MLYASNGKKTATRKLRTNVPVLKCDLKRQQIPSALIKAVKRAAKPCLLLKGLILPQPPSPNRIFDMATLEQQIRQFIANVGGRTSMSLPPMDKSTRKDVHELALAFKMKSVSHGKGEARYTVLSKTTRTGYGIDEKRVAYILRRHGVFMEPFGKGKNKTPVLPKHRDGDEVGKVRYLFL